GLVAARRAAPHGVHPEHLGVAALAEHAVRDRRPARCREWSRRRCGRLRRTRIRCARGVGHSAIIRPGYAAGGPWRLSKIIGGGSSVNDRAAIWFGAVAGAIVGGVCGYLFLTESGRRLREDLGPRLTDVMNELGRAQGTMQRAHAAVTETFPSE